MFNLRGWHGKEVDDHDVSKCENRQGGHEGLRQSAQGDDREGNLQAQRAQEAEINTMGSKSSVQTYTSRAIHAIATNDKLNAIAKALEELADFVDDLENQLRRIEANQRR
jgi:hypothetical protein